MRSKRPEITPDEHDKAIGHAYDLGYLMGQIEERNRQYGAMSNDDERLTFIEKQVVIIMQQMEFA